MVNQPVRKINELWLDMLQTIGKRGLRTFVRGRYMRELFNVTYEYHATEPIITVRERKLNYKFMAAEADWIIMGDDRVETIAKYNVNIVRFAPLGDRFYGAYGPKFVDQLDYVVDTLMNDRSSRQACMTFWTPNPPPNVDIACNDHLTFYIREGLLFLSVTARSKDAWMGLPYDVFSFSMMLHKVACELNKRRPEMVEIGTITFLDVNVHLYEDDVPAVEALLELGSYDAPEARVPSHLVLNERGWPQLLAWLADVKTLGFRGFSPSSAP